MTSGFVSCLPNGVEQHDAQTSVDAGSTTKSQDAIGDEESLLGRLYAKVFGSSIDEQQSLPDDQDSDDDDEEEDEEDDESVLDLVEDHPGKIVAGIIAIGAAIKLSSTFSAKKPSHGSTEKTKNKEATNSAGIPPKGSSPLNPILPTEPVGPQGLQADLIPSEVKSSKVDTEKKADETENKQLNTENDKASSESAGSLDTPRQGSLPIKLISPTEPAQSSQELQAELKSQDGKAKVAYIDLTPVLKQLQRYEVPADNLLIRTVLKSSNAEGAEGYDFAMRVGDKNNFRCQELSDENKIHYSLEKSFLRQYFDEKDKTCWVDITYQNSAYAGKLTHLTSAKKLSGHIVHYLLHIGKIIAPNVMRSTLNINEKGIVQFFEADPQDTSKNKKNGKVMDLDVKTWKIVQGNQEQKEQEVCQLVAVAQQQKIGTLTRYGIGHIATKESK